MNFFVSWIFQLSINPNETEINVSENNIKELVNRGLKKSISKNF